MMLRSIAGRITSPLAVSVPSNRSRGSVAARAEPRRTSDNPKGRTESEDAFWEREDVATPLAGEWPPTHSISDYEVVSQHYREDAKSKMKAQMHPQTPVYKAMCSTVITARPDQAIESIKPIFDRVSGIPIVHADRVVGILSRRDAANAPPGALVRDRMSRGAWVVSDKASVEIAAAIMLKHKVHRLPVVDSNDRLVGIITRTDVFTALAMDSGTDWHRL